MLSNIIGRLYHCHISMMMWLKVTGHPLWMIRWQHNTKQNEGSYNCETSGKLINFIFEK